MFTPQAAPEGMYRVYVTDTAIERVAEAFRAVAHSDTVKGAWTVEDTDPLSAFGEAGLYDRTKLARLYVGVKTRVVRGPIVRNGRTVRSVTIVSPYPDASLTHLERGSIIIEFDVSSSVRSVTR